MDKPSLALQRQAIEHLLNVLVVQEKATGDDRYQQMIEMARWGCRTLAWFERRGELIRKVHELEGAEPLLAEIVGTFPDATLRGVECPT